MCLLAEREGGVAVSGGASARIFISYRRTDTGWPARWLADRLAGQFGAGVVFQDVDSIQPGDDFAAAIEAGVGACAVLLAVIGPQWLAAEGDAGRRLDDPQDWVRLEIEAALRRGVRVIPVLVDGARMPTAAELPPSLRDLVRRQAVALSPANLDTSRLVSVLGAAVADKEAKGQQPQPVQMPESPPRDRSRSAEGLAIPDRVHKRIVTSLEQAKSKRNGTKLAIVGPMASGKTVIHTFLATGVLLSGYQPTLGAIKLKPTRFELDFSNRPISKYLAKRLDVAGDFRSYPLVWQQALNDAFFVIYLFDVNKFLGNDAESAEYRHLVVEGSDLVGGLIRHPDTKVVLAGTHCDLKPGWNLTTQGMNNISRLFWKHDEAEKTRNHLAKNTREDAAVIFGSLKDQQSAAQLLYSIFDSDT